MGSKGYRGRQRSNQEWVAALQDDRSQRQVDAFADLGEFLRYYILNDIYQRANNIAALAPLAPVELEAVADEIVQEAFIRIYKHVAQFVDTGSFLNYALVIARRILIDEFRKKQWTTTPLSPLAATPQEGEAHNSLLTLDDLPDPKETLTAVAAVWQEMAQIVYDAIREDLSESQAQAFLAYEFANMSSKQIAVAMGRSPMAVDQLRHQARLKIKLRLEAHGYSAKDLEES
jgi:RNA polymerase sigma factor (sigma-70 family)